MPIAVPIPTAYRENSDSTASSIYFESRTYAMFTKLVNAGIACRSPSNDDVTPGGGRGTTKTFASNPPAVSAPKDVATNDGLLFTLDI